MYKDEKMERANKRRGSRGEIDVHNDYRETLMSCKAL